MPELESKRRPPRFPCIGALLCAACVGAAAWTWMRYSYCWDVTLRRHSKGVIAATPPPWYGSYVKVRGTTRPCPVRTGGGRTALAWVYEGKPSGRPGVALRIRWEDLKGAHLRNEWVGRTARVRARYPSQADLLVDTTRGRFTGASVAGLVVGAMGVFVFTVALRHWLRERTAIMELGPHIGVRSRE